MQKVCVLLVVLLSLLFPANASTKKGNKLEETSSFDVKPSGQIAHQTLKLVSQEKSTYKILLLVKLMLMYQFVG